MVNLVRIGRHLSWSAPLLLVCLNTDARSVSADELPSAVNFELLDLAQAFRSLDQSFHYRGMASSIASTSGAAFLDRAAKDNTAGQPLAPVPTGCRQRKSPDCHCGRCKKPIGPQAVKGNSENENCDRCEQRATNSAPVLGPACDACSSELGVPLHPRNNNCGSTIGIPLHNPAYGNCHSQQGVYSGCNPCVECMSGGNQTSPMYPCEKARCEICYVVEQYRDGVLTRTHVRCKDCCSKYEPQN